VALVDNKKHTSDLQNPAKDLLKNN